MVKQNVAHPYHGKLLSKEYTLDNASTWMSLKGIMLSEKSQYQKAT